MSRQMLSVTIIVLLLLVATGICVAAISVAILWKGTLYHRIKPEARPRRWVLISSLGLFAIFIVWFPVWITWPHAVISRALTLLFGLSFGVFGLTFKWFAPLVDTYIKRKGWPLR